MSLRNRAILELEADQQEFEFHIVGPEFDQNMSRQFVMGDRGQYLREIYDMFGGDTEDGLGYYIDGGAGVRRLSITFEAGFQKEHNGNTVWWGDKSSDPDNEDDYNKYDATGAHPVPQMQLLDYWSRQAQTDSRNAAHLHIGEWTDGSYSDSAGVFESPLDVVIEEANVSRDGDEPSSFEGRLETIAIATFPDTSPLSFDAPTSDR